MLVKYIILTWQCNSLIYALPARSRGQLKNRINPRTERIRNVNTERRRRNKRQAVGGWTSAKLQTKHERASEWRPLFILSCTSLFARIRDESKKKWVNIKNGDGFSVWENMKNWSDLTGKTPTRNISTQAKRQFIVLLLLLNVSISYVRKSKMCKLKTACDISWWNIFCNNFLLLKTFDPCCFVS